jgi:glycerophosphoryl diester phosphodiesterase
VPAPGFRPAFLLAPPPVAFAHRGFAPDGAENSMAAFERAVALGYRYLETDVRVTADGVAVAFHDASLDRVTDRRGHVGALPWTAVRGAQIGGTEPICVGAFSTGRIAAVRRALGPQLCTSLGPRAALRLRLTGRASPALRARLAGRCAQVPARIGTRAFVDARYVAAAHALGLPVHAWTVNDAAEMNRLLDLGVDGIMTDRADLLRDLLISRGQWHGVQ